MQHFKGPGRQRGFLAAIGKAIAGPLGAAAIGAIGSFLGAKEARDTSLEVAREQMDFQERMSSTAHQREIIDLKAAGLNPILSGTGGAGASSPPGAMPPISNMIDPAISTALQSQRTREELKNIIKTNENIVADTELKSRQGALVSQNYNVAEKEEERKLLETKTLAALLKRIKDENVYIKNEAGIARGNFGKSIQYINKLIPIFQGVTSLLGGGRGGGGVRPSGKLPYR